MEIVMEVSSDFYYLTLKSTGGLLSMGSHRVGHNWSGLAAEAAALLSEFECKHFISIAPFIFTTALWDVSTLLFLFYRWRNRITDAATHQW